MFLPHQTCHGTAVMEVIVDKAFRLVCVYVVRLCVEKSIFYNLDFSPFSSLFKESV